MNHALLSLSAEETKQLSELERSRQLASWVYIRILLLFILFLAAPVVGECFFRPYAMAVVVITVLWGASLAALHWYFFQRGHLDMNDIPIGYKRIYLPKLMGQLLPGWKLAFGHGLSLRDIADSGLYRENLNSIIRDDYLTGKLNNSIAEIFQVSLQMKYRTSGGRYGTGSVRYVDLFTGLFIRITTPIIFHEHLWIFPRKRKGGGELDEWTEETIAVFTKYPTVKYVVTNDLSFDAQFVVFAANPRGFMKELDQQKRACIVRVASMFPFNSAFSFRDKHIYMMIGFENDVFDFYLNKPVDEEEIERVYQEILSVKTAVELIAP